VGKRINVELPEKTSAVLDRMAQRGNRSSIFSRVELPYLETQGGHSLRERLKSGYLANANENLKIAAEWFALEEEAWQKHGARRRV
jgi:hypothetical protein